MPGRSRGGASPARNLGMGVIPGEPEEASVPGDVDYDKLADEAEMGYVLDIDEGRVDSVAKILNSTTDAAVWAHHFKRQFGDQCPSEYTMLSWFANAIGTGQASANAETERLRRLIASAYYDPDPVAMLEREVTGG